MFTRYSVLNLISTPPPPAEMGCGGGDKKCRKSKESPPWVCEKCAKKTAEEKRRGMMGCGDSPEEEEQNRRDMTSEARIDLGCPVCKAKAAQRKRETEEATLDLGRDGHSIGCMSRPPGAPDETSEGILDLGCDKCQKGKKRRQAAAKQFQDSMPSGWLNLNGAGMLGQVPLLGDGGRGGRAFTYDHDRYYDRYCDPAMEECPTPFVGPMLMGPPQPGPNGMFGEVRLAAGGRGGQSVPYSRNWENDEEVPPPFLGKRCTGEHRYMGQSYGCPASPAQTNDPTLNCQRDARGNAVCSNGVYYPPGCPHTPPEEFFSPGIAPDEVHNGILEARVPAPRAAGSSGASGVPSAPGAAPSSGATNVLPLAAGGIAVAGLLYAILR